MNTVWIIVLVTLLSSGDVKTEVKYPLQPQFNNEKSCNESGAALANEAQLKVGLDNGKVYWQCTELPIDDLDKASKRSGTSL